MFDKVIERSHFDTQLMAPGEGFQSWREEIGVVFDVSSYDENTEARFQASVDSLLLDDISINHCRLGAMKFDRSTSKIALDGLDHYQLHIYLGGSVDMTIGGRSVTAKKGDFVNLDLAEIFHSETTDYEILNIFIPRRRLASRLSNPDATHGMVFDGVSGPGRMLADYVVSLYQSASELTKSEAVGAAEALVQLAALALNRAQIDETDPPEATNHALLLRAQSYIKQNLNDPELNPGGIAMAIGISRARLYRVFSAGAGVAEYIREMRLRRAFTDLISPRTAHLQIAQIAYIWGFKDPGHFSRLFKVRFNAHPRDVREMGGEAAMAQLLDKNDGAVDTKFAFWISSIA